MVQENASKTELSFRIFYDFRKTPLTSVAGHVDSMSMDVKYNTIVFLSFESEFAPCGGLTAVMRMLPRELALTEPTILITPFFSRMEKSIEACSRGAIQFTGLTSLVRYNGRDHQVRILEYREKIGSGLYKIYFVDSEQFFIAATDPYVNPGREEQLFEDALFFCAAVPAVLHIIPEQPPFLLHLQDWETACVVVTVPAGSLHRCFLTLHNPYDHSLTGKELEKITGSEIDNFTASTVLSYCLPKMAGISTVSSSFASELTSEPLHTRIFAPHLQAIFREKGIKGIENGAFTETRFQSISNPLEVQQIKDRARKSLLNLFKTSIGKKMLENCWGTCDLTDTSLPLILMFGRDDPRQKGYDVAAEAVRKVLTAEGVDFARFIFTPIPGQRGIDSLQFLKELAEEFNTSVMVFPFRMQVGYTELQFSASYLLMTSLYEPFGGATEGYANAVPVIARATGGLIQQVYPKNYVDLGKTVQLLVDKYHGDNKSPSGFLFREKEDFELVTDWQGIIRAEYLDRIPFGDPIAERRAYPLFTAMVAAAAESIKAAVQLYKTSEREYAELVINGLELLKKFTWQQAANKYLTELYQIRMDS